MESKIMFPEVRDGETFELAGLQFIKFPDEDGMTPVVAKDILFDSSFGDSNNLAASTVLKRLTEEFLPMVENAVGKENLCLIRTDLTTLDGLKPYEDLESFVSLPTLDFYRKHVEIFDRHNPRKWWWLATPESAKPHDDLLWTLCVAPSGRIYCGSCSDDIGVRPFCILKSSIFESCEE